MNLLAFRSLLTLVLGPLAWVTPVLAQTPGTVRTETGAGEEKTKSQGEDKKGQKGQKSDKEKGEAKGDAGDGADGSTVSAVNVNPAALVNFAFAQVSTRPRRLAPGESGSLMVVVTLTNPAVVPGNTAVALEYQPKQAALALGGFVVAPATLGTLDTKFKGQPVHDNTMTIEIPITVDQDTKRSDLPVSLTLKTTLTNGSSGQPMGELVLPVSGKVTIGRSVPRPGTRDDAAPGMPAATTAAELKPAVAKETPRTAEPPKAVAPKTRATMTATSAEGVTFDVAFPAGSTLALGATTEATAVVHVPSGSSLSRRGQALTLEVVGADHGVEAIVSAWPEATMQRLGEAELPVSSGTVSVPVLFTAASDAAVGLRNLDFRLTFSLVDGSGSGSAPQTLVLPAVLAVGMEPTVANPWIFYAAGAGLAGLLLILVLRGLRK